MDTEPITLVNVDDTTTQLNLESMEDIKNYLRTDKDSGLRNFAMKDNIVVKELKLRNYQEELCVEALKGNNSIICAPTGSGKTIVAVHIIREHLRRRIKENKTARVVMLVPTVNLIDQQEKVIKQYLSKEYRVGPIKGGQTGASKMPKALMLHQLHIAVMTPQIFVNMLASSGVGDIDDNNGGSTDSSIDPSQLTVDIFDVSMMIFDECHHCDKAHAYNEVMAVYFEQKQLDASKLPQIIGMTASLGVGQADTSLQAIDHVVKICANLDSIKLCIVELNREELEEFVYSPKDRIESVRCPHNEHALSKSIIQIMKVLEQNMEPIFKHLEDNNVKKTKEVTVTPPEKRWSSHYTCWMYQWYHYAPLLGDSEMKRRFITLLEHSIIYHKSLEINALAPTIFAVDYLKTEFENKNFRAKTQLDKDLIQLYISQQGKFDMIANNDPDKPIVTKLQDILLQEYQANNDCRSLIFVRTRELAVAVKKFINTDVKLKFLNANHLTGANSKKELGGLTQREQEDCLEKFRTGVHKVIVATTVAEEGLDIDKCNLVIKYNHVTNEIALVQRRGRGRAKGSKSILLTYEGWIQQKEMVNLLRERLMKTAIEIIKTKSEAWFINEINTRIKQMRQEKDIEKNMRETKRKLLGNKKYQLLCKKCDLMLSSSEKIRQVQQSHFISIDPEIWQRVKMVPKNPMQLFSELAITGMLFCTKCNNELGTAIKYCQVYLPTLKADCVLLYQVAPNHKETVKKWKQIQEKHFVVEPVQRKDLVPMHQALQREIRQRMDAALALEEAKHQKDSSKQSETASKIEESADDALAFIEAGDEMLEKNIASLIDI